MGRGTTSKRPVVKLPSSVTIDFVQIEDFPQSKLTDFSNADLLALRETQAATLAQTKPMQQRLDEAQSKRWRLLDRVERELLQRDAVKRIAHAKQTLDRNRSTAPLIELIRGKMGVAKDLPLSHVLLSVPKNKVAYSDSLRLVKPDNYQQRGEVKTVGELCEAWKKGKRIDCPGSREISTAKRGSFRVIRFDRLQAAWAGDENVGRVSTLDLDAVKIDLRHLAESVVMHAKGDCFHDTYDPYEDDDDDDNFEDEDVLDPWERD